MLCFAFSFLCFLIPSFPSSFETFSSFLISYFIPSFSMYFESLSHFSLHLFGLFLFSKCMCVNLYARMSAVSLHINIS